MDKKSLFKNRNNILIYTLLVFMISSFIYLSLAFIKQTNLDEVNESKIINTEYALMDVKRTTVINKINKIISDLLYISDTFKINDEGNYSEIEEKWITFSNRKKIYDQIRFIDTSGNEVVRVNYDENGSYSINKEDLQNKSDRYYFKNTLNLDKNQICLSKIDLNIENNKIEQPIKPTLRLSTPFYGDDNNLKGVIILNYYVDDLFYDIKTLYSVDYSNLFMLNSDGYWLLNEQHRNKEWAFMYDSRENESFKNEFKSEWNSIKKDKQGSIVTSNGIFTFSNILESNEFLAENRDYSISICEGDWYLVSHIDESSPSGSIFFKDKANTLFDIIKQNFFICFLLFLLALFFVIILTFDKIEKDKIKYFSQYDTMTGLYNRRFGIEKLNNLYKNIRKNKNKLTVCFIDINGLKEVNDTLGHKFGDELILSFANIIKKNIRKTDFAIRLGGDEFLIVFEELDKNESEEFFNLIRSEFEKINTTENRDYIISASHGMETLNFDSNRCIDEVINTADEKMYIEKKIIKKDLKIIR